MHAQRKRGIKFTFIYFFPLTLCQQNNRIFEGRAKHYPGYLELYLILRHNL